MKLQWTKKGLGDLTRLHEFLAAVDPRAAAHAVQTLTAVVRRLPTRPRIGEKLEHYEPREVRRIFVGNYEVRYEIREGTIIVVRLWHAREER